ncbi:FAS-associated factor 2 isoform X1 [Artibeus jamaicensis]|uniref:FAS-associated factor 2 isoform X1 n=1 Tax=Artibeus jamaicensis TaxID=9417 RepID=UPI00235A7799|nr:FAS-associated factor 2 isoform X1 [Artibeus jamaicensis]
MAAPEERDLTQEQTEKLLQFQDLTGIESMDQCRRALEQHSWNIEAAVQDRLNEQEGVPSVFNPPPSRPLQVNTADHRIYSYVVSRPQPRGLLGWGYYLIMLPFRFTYYTILDIFRFALRFIRPDPRSRVTDPVGDIVSFMHSFEEKYGRAHPVFYQGTYSQALNDAKRELRFLLVYLHGDDHQDSDGFCRNTLCAPEVISLINTRMLFWACSTNKPEGYRVSQALRENTYPFLAMIMLKDRRMTVVGRLEGLIQPDDLINQLTFIMDANQTYLVSERLEREERNQTQVLRQQQDEAYLASLRADQEKERKKREEREQKRREEEEVKQQKLAEERRRRVMRLSLLLTTPKQNLQEEKERKLECLPPEPSPDDPDSVKIIFKLPNDSRVERRFHFSQSLTVIHDFLFSLKESPEKFQIEANFPRRVLPCIPSEERPNPPTLQEAGLSHTEVLFVQDLTDE